MAKDKIFEESVQGVTMSELRRGIVDTFMEGYLQNKRPWSIMASGPPGGGKTMTVLAAGREISNMLSDGIQCEVVPLLTSCLDPVDITGAPFAVKIEGVETYSQYLPLEWAWRASKEYEVYRQKEDSNFVAPPMILFFDDIVAAHFQTQTAFFKLVHEGLAGHLHLRNNVMVVAAGNRVEDNAGANDMPTALASRFRWYLAKNDTQDWINWASKEGNIHPYVIGYIRLCPQDLNEFNAEVANRSEKSYACNRTWEMVSDFLHGGRIGTDELMFAKSIMGMIGRGIATKFLAFMKNTTACIDPKLIVKDPFKTKIPKKTNLDALYATISSLEYYVRNNPIGENKKEIESAAKYMNSLNKKDSDVSKLKIPNWRAALIYALRENNEGQAELLPDVAVMLAQSITEVITEKLSDEERIDAISDKLFEKIHEKYADAIDVEIK